MLEPRAFHHEVVVIAGDELRAFELPERGEVSLGRDPTNRVCIDHPSVSRQHAVLRLGTPITIEDLGGANGTFCRDKSQLDGVGKTERLRRLERESAELSVGETVLLGAVSVVVRRRHERHGASVVIEDASMRTLYAQADRAALALINVLLMGETGVGKEVVARSIHARSPRAQGPFVGINCVAFNEGVLEAELFGHEKGAFTGAVQGRPGLFEAAGGGTIFLDEVGELALATQAKLLRVLEERAVLRIGAREPKPINARFIAATNRDLEADVASGRFRKDLFYRLNGMSLTIPPLRERPSEIEPLAQSFVRAACAELERPLLDVSAPTLSVLQAHAWPGNVRELRNVMERAVVLCTEPTISPEHLPAAVNAPSQQATYQKPAPAEVDPQRFQAQLDSLERARIVEALSRSDGNQTRAAKLLGVSRRTLASRLAELDLPRPRKPSKP